MVGLGTDDLHELAHAVLHLLDDVRFELRKGVLHTDQILSVVVFLLDLLVQAVVNTTLQDVWVIRGFQMAAVRVVGCSILAKKLNLLLSVCASFVNSLAALPSSFCKLLALVLDLGV
jgi:predicted membrane channel-forming protein YqfA (hemolysin III family)